MNFAEDNNTPIMMFGIRMLIPFHPLKLKLNSSSD